MKYFVVSDVHDQFNQMIIALADAGFEARNENHTLITLGDISEDQSSTTFPNWIKANINTEIANLSYDNFTATNLSGKIQYNNGTLKGFNMSGNSLDGNISGDFIFTEPKNKHLMLLGDINFTKIITVKNGIQEK